MAEITKITQQKRNKEYYNIFLDGEYSFSMHGELIVLHGIKKGKNLDPQEMKGIIQENNKKKAFNASLHYLSYKARTQWEIEEYLKKKEFEEEAITASIKKLIEYKLIDDEVYVKSFIHNKKVGNPIGRRKLLFDLGRRGIGEEILENIEQWFSVEDEYEQAKRIVIKYNKKYDKHSYREKVYKIGQAGQRNGFSWEIMKEAIKEMVEEVEEEENPYPKEVDRDKALQWAQKYKDRYEKRGWTGFKLKQKTAQALMGRGYQWEVIEEILKEVLD